jgi:hypothetical protein
MKFTLTYTGELPASGNRPKSKLPTIWAIRNKLADQLANVLNTHPAISSRGSTASRAAYGALRNPIERSGHKFFPLVRHELGTVCGLTIKMLVNHEVGSIVTQAGDLDNRLKTLLDALRVPKDNEFRDFAPEGDCPCLLHDDAMVVQLAVSTERWFSAAPKSEKDVELHTDVRIWTARPNDYTEAFGTE